MNNPNSAGDYFATYAFDLNTNRVRKVVDDFDNAKDETITSTFNARDQILSADSTINTNDSTFNYDANGSTLTQTTNGNAKNNIWDLRNRLIGFDANGNGTLTDAGDVKFAYDNDGTRVERQVVGGESTVYLQDNHNFTGYSQILEEVVNGQLQLSFMIGSDVIAQAKTGLGVQFLMCDGHGSTRALTDTTGNLVGSQTLDYDAYGNAANFDATTAGTQLLYAGELFDSILMQYMLRARYYNQSIGEFSSFDFGGSMDSSSPMKLHKYSYTPGNPVMYLDASGNEFSIAGISVAAGITGLLGGLTNAGIQLGINVVKGKKDVLENVWAQFFKGFASTGITTALILVGTPLTAAVGVGTFAGNVIVDYADGDVDKNGWMVTCRDEAVAAAEAMALAGIFGAASEVFSETLPENVALLFSNERPIQSLLAGIGQMLEYYGLKAASKAVMTRAEKLAAGVAIEGLKGGGLFATMTIANQVITNLIDALREDMHN